jgi:hypothetical protein
MRPVVLNLVRYSMAKSAAKLKCRFASNSMPQGYGHLREVDANRTETS